MNLRKLYLTKNACYKAGRTITPKGIMVHSTGANNPYSKRYVGPDDGLLGKNQYNNHWNNDKPDGRQVCVHGFIGKLQDGSVATYQTLPWNHRGWHAGGAANDTHISFEICEDGLNDSGYFRKVFNEAVELCVYLCKLYKLDETDIICHCEGYKKGLASNHSDVMHWFPRHGESMNSFRAAVKRGLEAGTPASQPTPDDKPELTPPPSPDGGISIGTLVSIRADAKNYYPGGKAIPVWAISGYNHRVTQDTLKGKPMVKGGKTCVLLGKRVTKDGGAEETGINTWIDVDALEVVGAALDGGYNGKTYTVKKGDTLWGIAEAHLGDGARYTEIKALNGLTSDTLSVGKVLKLPNR